MRRQDVPGEEVQLDALLGQADQPAVGLDVLPAALILAGVQVDLDEAVADEAAGQSRLEDGRTLDLPESMGRAERAGDLGQEMVDMDRASPQTEDGGRIGQRGVKAVQMPAQTAEGAGNDGFVVGSGALTAVADDSAAFGIAKAEVVDVLVIVLFLLAASAC